MDRYEKRNATATEIITKYGGKEVEGYCLISNYGYRFLLGGIECDARFWANSYGCYIGRWEVFTLTDCSDEVKALTRDIARDLNEYIGDN